MLYIRDKVSRKNKLDKNLPLIEAFFDTSKLKSLSKAKFTDVLNKHRYEWKIPSDIFTGRLLSYLQMKEKFHENFFIGTSNEPKAIYSWKTKDEFTIIAGLKSDSYFAYYTSLFLHQLTLQIPKTIYLNFEHTSEVIQSDYPLTQEDIDSAFKGSQRKSSNVFSFQDKKIILTNGKFTGRLGVISQRNQDQSFDYTDIERTLIDCVVRPGYAGGVFEVLDAFKRAKPKIDVEKLASYLKKLDFRYPYHQAIGFYLEKAGYDKKEVQLLEKKIKFSFYLTYDMRITEFSEKWKLYYPKGF